MNTNEFARILLTWIKSFLSWIGIPRDRLNELDEIIFLILIVEEFYKLKYCSTVVYMVPRA